MPTSALELFHPIVRGWFTRAFEAPTRAQSLGWPSIVDRRSTLLLAPTGSGKTLAAFLASIDRVMTNPQPHVKARCRVLYVSPLKALAFDVERNLRAPIAGIRAVAAQEGVELIEPVVDVRTGDTPATARARMARRPPDILITTPESLYLMLTSAASSILGSVETVIVDEIHAMVASKRGAHLFLSLERLEALRKSEARARRVEYAPMQRIGLSATQRPLDEVARLLGGRGDDGAFRPVDVVDASEKKAFDLQVTVPVEDMARLDDDANAPAFQEGDASAPKKQKSIWPSIHPRILELIRAHKSTIVFVNSRRLAERLAGALNDLAGEEIVLAHHGSVAREKRVSIEDRLKKGELPAIVATSSLELGIDMGAVDLVVQIEPPPSIAAAMQRVGRAGHSVGAISRGVIFPKHRGDLLGCAATAAMIAKGEVEETFYPRNPLDVLAQQIVAHVAIAKGKVRVDDVFALMRSAAPFAELARSTFEGVLDMLSGRYPSDEFAELRPRITWDRVGGTLSARDGTLRLAVVNGGTIVDRGLYGVFLADRAYEQGKTSRRLNPRIGELDEEMVFESRVGEVFVLGATSWKIEEISLDRVLVSPAPGEPGKMPFWHGDRPGRPIAFGRGIGALARTLAAMKPAAAIRALTRDHGFDARAAKNLVQYLAEQREATGVVPSDDAIVVERFVDEVGDFRVCVLTPFGAKVHAPWSMAIVARLRETNGVDVDSMWSDDGMAFRVPAADAPPKSELFFPRAEEIENAVVAALGGTSLFAARFREAAARSLLLPRRHPTKRTPLWAQRKRAGDLLAVAARHPAFPVILEAYRDCLRDAFDLPALVDLLRAVEQRRIKVVTVDTRTPSPFAASLLFSYVANFLYDGDQPLAERRAAALGVDHAQLRQLLGEAELRELLDPAILEEHERMLQRLDGKRPIETADQLHDALLAIGDLSIAEIDARAGKKGVGKALTRSLDEARRAFAAKIGGQTRWIAIEDVARYREALGVSPPRGVPRALLEPVADPIGDLVSRYARTHAPFVPRAIVERLGLAESAVVAALDRLAAKERVVSGEFLRRGTTREWCDVEVLGALRRKSLARLRKEVEPVDGATYARFLLEWQQIARVREGDDAPAPPYVQPSALLAAIERIEGVPIPFSVLERDVLPARLPGFRPTDLDALCAAGEVVWAGVEPLGSSGDGRIALYLADHEPLLARAPSSEPIDELASKVRTVLARRGAVFFNEIVREIGGFPGELVEALWTLVWRGEVTNDTLVPLRARLTSESSSSPRRRPAPRLGGPLGSEGRWSLRASRWARVPSETEQRTAVARTLLDRHGVVVREAVHAEGIPDGFAAVYAVMKAMEDAGKVRRGYFIAGCGGAQFGLPAAVDRLRAMRAADDDEAPIVLAATDPANPYGAALPWPENAAPSRPMRAAGASVILDRGSLVGFLGRTDASLLTFLPLDEAARARSIAALAKALAALVDRGQRRALLLATIDGAAPVDSPIAPALAAHGFRAGPNGWQRRPATSAPAMPRRRDARG